MKKYITVITLLLLAVVNKSFSQKKYPKIIVGPNVQVSHDGSFNHVEYMFAGNPKDPNNLIGMDMILDDVVVYTSEDGGRNWDYINFPESGGGDPQAAFNNKGVAYVLSYGLLGKEGENYIVGLEFYTSYDKGKTWQKSSEKNLIGVYDRPQLTIDQTNGKFSGRIYISVLGDAIKNKFPNSKSPDQSTLRLFHSDDNGQTFGEPQIVLMEKEGKGCNVSNLLISSKGTLFLNYCEWYNSTLDPNYFSGMDMYLISSKDGGVTFSSPKKVTRKTSENGMERGSCSTIPQYAIDNKSVKYRDRIYCVFDNFQDGKLKIMFTYSSDEGNTWAKPKLVDLNTISKDADQYSASVAVNSNGIVGVRWYDTRGTELRKGFNEYFTASIDGGETFLPPVKVSSKMSYNRTGLVFPIFNRSDDRDSLIISFKNIFFNMMLGIGGDYLQFTTDANGMFHDFWTDSRDGNRFQIYTSAIKVVQSDSKENNKKEKVEKSKNIVLEKNRSLKQIARYIYLQIDSTVYDTTTNMLSIPVRLKNISSKPIYGPINLTIDRIDTSKEKYNIPIILNSDNDQQGAGAVYNYALKKSNVLLPGEETETLIWRFNVKIPSQIIKLPTKELMDAYHTDKDYLIKWLSETIADLNIHVTGWMGE